MVGRSGQAEMCAVRGKVCMWAWGDERGAVVGKMSVVLRFLQSISASVCSINFFFFWPVILPFVYPPYCTRSQGKVGNRPAC